MNKIEPRTLKGFRDFLPNEARKRQYIIEILKKVFESYGFERLETPSLEYEDILLGKYGEEGDKLMYRFEDNGGRRVALRYDQTVPLARVVAQFSNTLPTPFKRYQMQNVWRADNTQKGRFREFLQCDIDTISSDSPMADAEIIACAAQALKKLGFEKFRFFINDRKIFKDISNVAIGAIDKLKKIGEERVVEELVTRGEYDTSEKATQVLLEIKQSTPTYWIEEVISKAKSLGVDENQLAFTPTLARGLDYYTSTIIELEIEGYTAGSVGGGGRYDNLIGIFSGQDIPAVGFAFGFDRLIEAMEEKKLFPPDLTTTKVLVTTPSPKLLTISLSISNLLRSNSINTEVWLDENAKLERQFKYAEKKDISYVVIPLDNETVELRSKSKSGKITKNKLRTDQLLEQFKYSI
ncbi:MAG: histidine--tRNA ligase [Candidatus Levybacteria bacterium]|nr:histidine--tRNA ligase [Candidatus Levybacteria bacterium]